ncbi:MAG: hypothetical protein ABFD82_13305 [Syntrophaceae bacterium]
METSDKAFPEFHNTLLMVGVLEKTVLIVKGEQICISVAIILRKGD